MASSRFIQESDVRVADGGITVSEAGRLGGLAVSQKHGRDFFVRIGRKGQQVTRQKHPTMAAAWGRTGGRPRKPKAGEGGRQTKKKEVADPSLVSIMHPPFALAQDRSRGGDCAAEE